MRGRGSGPSWSALALALLCLGVWLARAWHLAVASHVHEHAAVHDHHDDHDHHRHRPTDPHDHHSAPVEEPEEHAPHQASDHAAPDGTRWSPPVVVLSLPGVVIDVVGPAPSAPRPRAGDDTEPATDPPRPTGPPRAPPLA